MKNTLKNTLLLTATLTTIFLIGCGKPNRGGGDESEHQLTRNKDANGNDAVGYTYRNEVTNVNYNFNQKHTVANNNQNLVYFYEPLEEPAVEEPTETTEEPAAEEAEDPHLFVLVGEKEDEESGHLTFYRVVDEEVLAAIETFRANPPANGAMPQDLLDAIKNEDNAEAVTDFDAITPDAAEAAEAAEQAAEEPPVANPAPADEDKQQ